MMVQCGQNLLSKDNLVHIVTNQTEAYCDKGPIVKVHIHMQSL